MLFSQLPVSIYKKIYPRAIFELQNKKEIALTFDDGPTPKVTEFVLNTLNAYRVKATFFCVGQNMEKYPGLYRQILQDGHTIGNHTFQHLNGWKTSNHEYFESIEQTKKYCSSPLFRPPYGKIKWSQYHHLSQKKYQIVFWNLISYDYHPKMTFEKCWHILSRNTTGGQIVLFHDSQKSFGLISKILPRYIEFCEKLNLTFVPL
ncbi:MAG: polysaccharide deacetylase family protein [Bacteroidetes bacterium]|nr:MAG: polysaccharide deacetylase family protein [Bacteroidota bacterium]